LSEKSGDGEKNENKVSFFTLRFYLVLFSVFFLFCFLLLLTEISFASFAHFGNKVGVLSIGKERKKKDEK
jgi:quinol-cytochrome oxidoreductase complex cytochrome b subunit